MKKIAIIVTIFAILSVCAMLATITIKPSIKVISIRNDSSGGSGFVLTPGVVITAGHVLTTVDGGLEEGMVINDGTGSRIPTTQPVVDPTHDRGTIKADIDGPTVRVRKPILGEHVRIIGYIYDGEFNPVRIEAEGRVISGEMSRDGVVYYLIQGAAGPGMSGCPIIGDDGAVVGILLGTDVSVLLVRMGVLE